ncbi:hypothetical protein G7Y79_00050g085400 [Physcia stellaris]|nr:hypothetical protein G7Y79_00050g085400 [Physcia stellaris]
MPSKNPPPTTLTISPLPFTYIHLTLLSSSAPNPSYPPPSPLDELTAHKYLTSALQQFLGLTGTAIPIDILKVDERDVWIRVPREDGSAVVAAVGNWVGKGEAESGGRGEGAVSWRVRGRGEWLGALVARSGIARVWGEG